MPWLSVNHTRLLRFSAVPTPLLALEVQRGEMPGHPGAAIVESLTVSSGPGIAPEQIIWKLEY
jgi:hypothetical protein